MYALADSDIPIYLQFGYLPDCATVFHDPFEDWLPRKRDLQPSNESSLESLVEQGLRVLGRAFKDASESGMEKHIVPLSGGLDSRAILCGLLENVDSPRIRTVTFGSPGTWDFEIGQQVARCAGVRSESVDLTAESWRWDTDRLVETASQLERPVYVFEAHVNTEIARRFAADCIYWSGFMGDPLAGSHLFKEDSSSWDESKERFIVKNRFVRSTKLTPPDFQPAACLPAAPFSDPNLLCYDEQIDFGIRQQCLIRNTVLPMGYEYKTPFLHPDWVSFILGAPRHYRENQRLYKEILKTAYPKLFSLPTKTNWGLPLGAPWYAVRSRKEVWKAQTAGRRHFPTMPWGIDPLANYVDFDQSLRQRDDLRNVVSENIQDLEKRGVVPWLDVEAIWRRHQQGQANHADALTLLASLEIYLKAQETQAPASAA